MTPQKPNRLQDDPRQDPEIRRWFHTLGPPPVGKAPPDLRVKVLAQIEQQRARHGFWAWLPAWSPAWTTAFALILGLSLGMNIWWSIRTFTPLLPPARQSAETRRDDFSVAGGLAMYHFQMGLPPDQEIGKLAAARPTPQEPTTIVGFTPQVERTTFISMGILYADILGALRGGAVDAAIQRLELLTQLATKVQAPRAISQYLHMVQTSLQLQQDDAEVAVRFLALFEPLYEDAYATTTPMAEEVILFRSGAWLETLSLAAASGDGAAVQRGKEMVAALRQGLARLQAPPEALEGLQRLHEHTSRAVLTDQDLRAVYTLVQQLQTMLSE